jgi:hypothetical protein
VIWTVLPCFSSLLGHSVAQLRYKLEGRGFGSRWCHWNFLCRNPGFESVSNRNEYQDYFLGGKGGGFIGLTNLPPSCAVSLNFLEPKLPGILRAFTGLSGIALPFFIRYCALNSLGLPKGHFVIFFTTAVLRIFMFFHSRHIHILMNYYKIYCLKFCIQCFIVHKPSTPSAVL